MRWAAAARAPAPAHGRGAPGGGPAARPAAPAAPLSMAATLAATTDGPGIRLAFAGMLDAAGTARLWAEATRRRAGSRSPWT